ncbi:mycothiol synthase [Zhihengliuella salsuginis]|uniref:Mycothiol acetyltransferase n=1 Tax=Zhihengliuella salsuginis TaxID=578222 RepID=A0ABQ3GNB6_9MICC|nr:mycothiol synthase [Zhihengliuella salsuginis]GHD13489.1 mycothiol acetyltransferase [Zhihengliuella salsuginis]
MTAETNTDWSIITRATAPTPEQVRAITALATAAEAADGNPPLSEQTLVDLRTGHASLWLALAYLAESDEDGTTAEAGSELVGVAVAVLPQNTDSPDVVGTLELVVHPSFRNDGIGSAMADLLAAQADLSTLQAWSHGHHAGAARLAERHGLTPVRELWRMRLTGHGELGRPEMPTGVKLRTFMPGHDDEKWLAANAAAFAHHPEQGSMTLADLHARMEEEWFDADGFFLAVGMNDEIQGFHWTKVHPASADATGEHASIGEVYVVGVVPTAQGTGLGKALTIAGINHLRTLDLHGIMLYVDADNESAVALYQKLGFTRWDVDVMYARNK